jgi:hypothetical protein
VDLEAFQAVLDHITFGDILRAVLDCHEGNGPAGFREASGWVLRIGHQDFAHRPVIARAAARTFGRDLTPQDFNGNNDKRAEWWLDQQGFDTPVIS